MNLVHCMWLSLSLSLSLSHTPPTPPPHTHTGCLMLIGADSDHPKYVINVKQFAKFVAKVHRNLAPTNVEKGMRVGYVPNH